MNTQNARNEKKENIISVLVSLVLYVLFFLFIHLTGILPKGGVGLKYSFTEIFQLIMENWHSYILGAFVFCLITVKNIKKGLFKYTDKNL